MRTCQCWQEAKALKRASPSMPKPLWPLHLWCISFHCFENVLSSFQNSSSLLRNHQNEVPSLLKICTSIITSCTGCLFFGKTLKCEYLKQMNNQIFVKSRGNPPPQGLEMIKASALSIALNLVVLELCDFVSNKQ